MTLRGPAPMIDDTRPVYTRSVVTSYQLILEAVLYAIDCVAEEDDVVTQEAVLDRLWDDANEHDVVLDERIAKAIVADRVARHWKSNER